MILPGLLFLAPISVALPYSSGYVLPTANQFCNRGYHLEKAINEQKAYVRGEITGGHQ